MLKLENVEAACMTDGQAEEKLKDICISFRRHGLVHLIGSPGSGVDALMQVISGVAPITSGDMQLNGQSTANYTEKEWRMYRNGQVGFLCWPEQLNLNYTLSFYCHLILSFAGLSADEASGRIDAVLKELHIAAPLHRKLNTLSTIELQQAMVAMGVVNSPRILLVNGCPNGGDCSDNPSEKSVFFLLLQKVAQNRLVIVSSRDMTLTALLPGRVVEMQNGKISADSAPYHFHIVNVPQASPHKPRLKHLPFSALMKMTLTRVAAQKQTAGFRLISGVLAAIVLGHAVDQPWQAIWLSLCILLILVFFWFVLYRSSQKPYPELRFLWRVGAPKTDFFRLFMIEVCLFGTVSGAIGGLVVWLLRKQANIRFNLMPEPLLSLVILLLMVIAGSVLFVFLQKRYWAKKGKGGNQTFPG